MTGWSRWRSATTPTSASPASPAPRSACACPTGVTSTSTTASSRSGRGTPRRPRSCRSATRTFDDLYALGEDRELAVTGGGRRVSVELGDGYPYAQVFAPPDADVVCLEPMTAPVNALVAGGYAVAPPGEPFTATFRIAVADEPGAG